MKTIRLTLLPSLFLLFTATSCFFDDFGIRGNGIVESETRYASSFSKIKSMGSFKVYVAKGDEFEVIVKAETNILPYIDIDVDGNTLKIDISGIHSIRNTEPMEVFITTPVLEGLKESGSGTIETDHFESSNFEVSISGSGTIETSVDCRRIEAAISGSGDIILSGQSDHSKYSISGSGEIDAHVLLSEDCEANISGSGDVFTQVERLLNVTISGSGNVFYTGHPDVNSHISGSGKIINDN